MRDNYIKHDILFKNIKENLPKLEEQFIKSNSHWVYEDGIYRYYHASFKVYCLQAITSEIVEVLKSISPHEDKENINELFLEILNEGTGKTWKPSHNKEWSKICRPIIEAFLQSKFFLEMAIKYGKELNEAPNCLPSGWAALLYFYKIR